MSETTAVPGPRVAPPVTMRSDYAYDADGRLERIAYDDDGDGSTDRRHRWSWGAVAPERREATLTVDPDDHYRVDYRYEHTTLLRASVEERSVADGTELASVTDYRYDRGQLVGIEEDTDADGAVDIVSTLEWVDLDAHVETRPDRQIVRTFGEGPRLLTSLEVPDDPEALPVRVWMTWSSDRIERPLQRTIDLGDDGLPDVTTTWSHDCP